MNGLLNLIQWDPHPLYNAPLAWRTNRPHDIKENIPRYLRYYKVDVTLGPDAGFGAIRVILV